jgi:hypothetical protein
MMCKACTRLERGGHSLVGKQIKFRVRLLFTISLTTVTIDTESRRTKTGKIVFEVISKVVPLSGGLVVEHDVHNMMRILICNFYCSNHIKCYI